MATTKNITVAGSGLIASVNTPIIRVTYDRLGITTSGIQYGIQAVEPEETIIDVQALNLGGGQAPDRSMEIGAGVTYTSLFSSPQISIVGHIAHTGDSYTSFAIGKGFSETKTFAEQLSNYLSTVKFDSVLKSDTVHKGVQKGFSDVKTSTDIQTVSIGKAVVDNSSAIDFKTVSLQKRFFETKHISDSFDILVNYRRSFTDIVDATDDFYGAANVDDDQVAYVIKSLIEYGNISEVFSKSTETVKLDSYTALDTKYLQALKTFTESLTKSDVVQLNIAKAFVETNVLADTYFIDITKGIADSTAHTEQYKLDLNKVLVDSSTTVDNFSLDVATNTQEAITNIDSVSSQWNILRDPSDSISNSDITTNSSNIIKAEQLSFMDTIKLVLGRLMLVLEDVGTTDEVYTQVSYNRLISDYIDATDDFYGITNVDDDQTVSVTKGIIDYPTTTDIPSFYSTKLLKDQYAAIDTLVLSTTRPVLDSFTKSDVLTSGIGKNIQVYTNSTDIASISISTSQVDLTNSFDVIGKQPNKNIVSSTSNQLLHWFDINKGIIDTSNTATLTSFNVFSNYSDALQIQNPLALNTTKKLLETLIHSDVSYSQAYKTTQDALNLKNTDTVKNTAIKTLTDAYPIVTDTASSTLSTTKTDTANISETKIQLVTNYFRNYLDSVDATDDFYGATNVDDDQIARLGKNVIDYGNTSELRSVYVTTVKQDTATNTDTPYKQTGKPTSDIAIASDVFSFNKVTDRDLADTQNVGDNVRINWQDYCEANIFDPTYVGQERFLSYN